jgi:Coenzyme PQQ synthesis protein D (PqqD)
MKNIIKTNHLAARIIEGKAFIINTKNSTLHELDETGTFIWKLIEKKKSLEEMTSLITSEFDVTSTQAENDLHEFLEALKQKGIIE